MQNISAEVHDPKNANTTVQEHIGGLTQDLGHRQTILDALGGMVRPDQRLGDIDRTAYLKVIKQFVKPEEESSDEDE